MSDKPATYYRDARNRRDRKEKQIVTTLLVLGIVLIIVLTCNASGLITIF